MGRRLAGWIGGMAAVAALPAACGKGEKEGDVPAKTGAYRDFLTVDIYDAQANFQGTQSGWFARMVKDCFNMELNLIFPNVAGGGKTLYETRAADGNPGDLIFVRADRNYLRGGKPGKVPGRQPELLRPCGAGGPLGSAQ